MARRRIQPDPLYNHLRRPLVSHQIGTSTGPTASGRPHITYNTSHVNASEPNVDEDYDMELPELMEVEQSDDEDEGVDVVHKHKVVAKEPSKRYKNSVSMCHILSLISN